MMRLRPPKTQGWRALLGVAVIVLSCGLIEAGPVQKRSPGDDMKQDNQPNLLYENHVLNLQKIDEGL